MNPADPVHHDSEIFSRSRVSHGEHPARMMDKEPGIKRRETYGTKCVISFIFLNS